jgi:FkbM family methyltransferase
MKNVRFIVRPKETGLVEAIYTGLLEFEDMAFFAHYIDRDDVFVDVGANVGVYTMLCCGLKGAKGYAFEPVLGTYHRLVENLRLNHLEERVQAIHAGVGDKPGILYFTSNENVTNHVLQEKTEGNSVEVKVEILDEVLESRKPSAMKIDVEGYEIPVLNGSKKILKEPTLNVVLIETNGSGLRYGHSDEQIVAVMAEYGFVPCSYDPFTRQLKMINGAHKDGNTLFVRNFDQIQNKVRAADPIEILDQRI